MSYVIEVHPTHLIARGTVPVAAVAAITSLAPAGAVPDVDLQERTDASLYLVVPDAAAMLRHTAPSRKLPPAADGLSSEARQWLATAEHCAAALAMLVAATGHRELLQGADPPLRIASPKDAHEFALCLNLHAAVPEVRANLEPVGQLSVAWRHIVIDWAQLVADLTMDPCALEAKLRAYQRAHRRPHFLGERR